MNEKICKSIKALRLDGLLMFVRCHFATIALIIYAKIGELL